MPCHNHKLRRFGNRNPLAGAAHFPVSPDAQALQKDTAGGNVLLHLVRCIQSICHLIGCCPPVTMPAPIRMRAAGPEVAAAAESARSFRADMQVWQVQESMGHTSNLLDQFCEPQN